MNYVPFRVSVSVRITFSRMRTGRYKLGDRVLDHLTAVKDNQMNTQAWLVGIERGISLGSA